MSQKININLRIDRGIRDSASLIAHDMWTNLSNIMNMFLAKFVVEKKFEIWIWNSEFQNFSDSEEQKIKSLDNTNIFMNSIQWK